MKRKVFNPRLKKLALAVPAAALMLGSSKAGVTVGVNFQSWYYTSGTNPQTVGYGAGYQTTGFPVTAKAFGVDAVNWFSTVPLPAQAAITSADTMFGADPGGTNDFAGTLILTATAPNTWQSGIGEQVSGWHPETVAPGDNEVTWGYLDDGNTTGDAPSASVSGLASKFPHGYVLQSIAAEAGVTTFDDVVFTDGVTTNTAAYATTLILNPVNDGADTSGTVGLSAQSGVFTNDTINIDPEPKTAGDRSTLCGFIITDQPVVSGKPVGGSPNQGSSFTLTAGVIGIPPIKYQWMQDGAPISGATNVSYTIASVTPANAGDYELVAMNLYGSSTSVVATITVQQIPVITKDLPGTTNILYAGEIPSLSVTAVGPDLSYIWLENKTTVVGSDSPSLTYALSVADSGSSFSVIVSNQFGTVSSTNSATYIVVATPNAYASAAIDIDAPGAWWPLNETNGSTIAIDYSGGGNNGVLTNGVTPGEPGPEPLAYKGFNTGNTAYLFDGSSGYVSCGTGPSLAGTTDFTVEAWVNTTNTAEGAVIQQRSHTGYNGEYQLAVNGNGTLSFFVYGNGYQFDFSSPASSKYVNDGQWHHIAAVRQNTNGILYIDGAMVAITNGPVAPLDATIATFIGADQRDSVTFFAGLISDVAVYPRALAPERIAAHAIIGVLGAGVGGVLPPIEITRTNGGFIADTKPSGTPHPGLNHGTTWLPSLTDLSNVTRTGVETFPLGRQIAIPYNSDFDSTNGTIAFWVNYNIPAAGFPGSGSEAAMLFDDRTTNGTIIAMNIAGGIEFQAAGGANLITSGYVVDGNWHHVVVTYDQSAAGTVTLYIDGAVSMSQANTLAWAWPVGQEIELGRSHDPYWHNYPGAMDDFRLYSRILTAAEVQSVYASGALVDTNTLKVQYNFDTNSVGTSLAWPVGGLQSTPTLAPSDWLTVSNANLTLPFLPPSGTPVTTNSSLFYRVGF